MQHSEPVAVGGDRHVGGLTHAADTQGVVLLLHHAALQPVAAERHHLFAKAAHLRAERHWAKGVPPFHQAAKNEIGHGYGYGQAGRFEGSRAGKFERHLARGRVPIGIVEVAREDPVVPLEWETRRPDRGSLASLKPLG